MTPVTSSVPAAGGDQCPACGSPMLADQRYCLSCGHRRGDPRLPFMDAVVFMDAAKQPQPAAEAAAAPPDRRPFMSANASLVAGVATLVLAIGVGVLIGRSGEGSSQSAAQPSVITVPAGGAAEASTSSKANEANAASSAKGKQPKSATAKKAKKKTETTQTGATKATEEAYPVNPNVHLAEPEQELGGKCDPNAAGCNSNGEFEGTFFE